MPSPFLTKLCGLEGKRIILASRSPRRIEMLQTAGLQFESIPAEVEENPREYANPVDFACKSARIKAEWVWQRNPADLVIGADTIVVKEEEIFGKPANRREARQMLEKLSGATHQVISGLCFRTREDARIAYEITDVVFNKLSEEEINAYLDTGESFDKAGAYAIQGYGGVFIHRISGSYPNVVGLPLAKVYQVLRQLYRKK